MTNHAHSQAIAPPASSTATAAPPSLPCCLPETSESDLGAFLAAAGLLLLVYAIGRRARKNKQRPLPGDRTPRPREFSTPWKKTAAFFHAMEKLSGIFPRHGKKSREFSTPWKTPPRRSAPRLPILFLCNGNSCRSQMAEGWARALKGDQIEAFSAGIETHGLNPRAVQVMAEAGVDISAHTSKTVADLPTQDFDCVVTVCDHAHESCPLFPGKTKVVHVGFDDPPRLAKNAKTEDEALAHYRRVRDEIKAFVETLPEGLGEAR